MIASPTKTHGATMRIAKARPATPGVNAASISPAKQSKIAIRRTCDRRFIFLELYAQTAPPEAIVVGLVQNSSTCFLEVRLVLSPVEGRLDAASRSADLQVGTAFICLHFVCLCSAGLSRQTLFVVIPAAPKPVLAAQDGPNTQQSQPTCESICGPQMRQVRAVQLREAKATKAQA
jgi:hypothetical protein